MGRAYYFRDPPGIWQWLVVAALLLVLDQLSKWWIMRTLVHGQVIKVNTFINLVLVYNEGAAFSFLAGASGWQRYFFITVSIVASILILYFMRRNSAQKLFCWSLSLILGGALGNLLDRVFHGHVVDFLDVYVRTWHWPAFNVADSAITTGAFFLVLDEFRRVLRSR
ncbi:MAG: signal peptidase II [Burkholderiaceae bacterium]|jgi:signal peptidase II|nr:signal peptidase II [Burkholderiaceae bacterium]